MKPLLRDYVAAVGSYLALLFVGVVMTLTISSAVGYLPYSDRPGPGWTDPHFSFALLGYYASWGLFLLIPSAIYGTVVFAYFWILKVLDAPSLIIRVLGALGAGVVSLVLAAGTGWYISMATFPAWVAAALGAAWGAFLLPRYLRPTRPPPVGWVTTQARLRVPKGVSIVYIQRGDRWDMFPPDAPTLRQVIRVGPGAKPNEATFAWPRSDTTTFSWAPD